MVTSAHTTTAQTALTHALTQDLKFALLPTVQVKGRDRSAIARALYTRLGLGKRRGFPGLDEAEALISAELLHTPRVVVAITALGLRPSALQLLHRLWEPEPFPLVLVGDSNLDSLLTRHDLADLYPHVIRHHVHASTTGDSTANASKTAPESVRTMQSEQLTDHVGRTARDRAILTVTGLDATTAPTALSRTPVLPNLPVVQVSGKNRALLVADLFVQLGLAERMTQPGTLWATEDLIAAELRRAPRLVIVRDAHELPATALRQLYDLWLADNFPLVLAGDNRLDDVLQRPSLAGLKSAAARHRLALADPTPQTGESTLTTPAPADDTPTAPSAAVPYPSVEMPTTATPTTEVAMEPGAPSGTGETTTAAPTSPRPTPSNDVPPLAAVTPLLPCCVDVHVRTDVATGPDAPGGVVPPAPEAAEPEPDSELPAGVVTRARAGAELEPDAPTGVVPPAPGAAEPQSGAPEEVVPPVPGAASPGRTAAPGPETDSAAVVPPSEIRGDDLAAPRPAPVVLAPAASPALVPAPAPDPAAPTSEDPVPPVTGAVPTALPPAGETEPFAPATVLGLVLAERPTTLHHARGGLPQMISAANEGTSTPLTRGTHHALLTSPTTATALGWDLKGATAHGTAAARRTLGDLIQAAADGHLQVLRRNKTPIAVLLPAAPDGTPLLPPAPHPGQPTPGTPDSAATTKRGNGVVTTPSAPASATPSPPAPDSRKAPADQLAITPSAACAAPRLPRRLAPLADALTTVLTPRTPDQDTSTATGPHALSTGIPGLDDALGGLQPGRFYLAAAAPGTGASLLATTTARTAALDHGLPVLYAASGLTRADVAARIVAAHLPVDYRRLRTGRLTPAEQADATTLHDELAAARLYIDDCADLTAAAIAETAADLTPTANGEPGLALVVVDRLQALDDPRLPLSGPRLTDAAQALAHLARTHHVPVLAILDSDHPDLIATLGLDTTLTLHLDPAAPTTHLLATIAERDLGTQATLTLTADRAHARLTNPTSHRPTPKALTNTPAPAPPRTP